MQKKILDLEFDRNGEYPDFGPLETIQVDAMKQILEVKTQLLSSQAFKDLSFALHQSLYVDVLPIMRELKQVVLKTASLARDGLVRSCDCSPLYKIKFHMQWAVDQFLAHQFGNDIPSIGSIIALTGSTLHAQATTCSLYLQNTWPRSAKVTLAALEDLLRSERADSGEKSHRNCKLIPAFPQESLNYLHRKICRG